MGASERHWVDRLPIFFTAAYVFICIVSWQWYSGYWIYYGLSFIEHTSVGSLLLGALNQPYILQFLVFALPTLAAPVAIFSLASMAGPARARVLRISGAILAALAAVALLVTPRLYGLHPVPWTPT
jgi:hypothetical protein